MKAVAMKESNSQKSWQMTTLGNLRGNKLRNINPMDFPDETFELWSVPSHSEGKPEIIAGKVIGSAKQSVVPNTVLLSKINPRINRVWIVADKKQYKQIASPEWIAFPPSEKVYPKYLMYFMQTQKFRDYLCMNVSGVGGSLTRARPKAIDDYEIPLAPPEQQKQIVDKIEELFSHIDAGIDALKQSKQLLKQYRQSVLKAAVTGELSKEWRDQNKDKLEPASKLLERIEEGRRKWAAIESKKGNSEARRILGKLNKKKARNYQIEGLPPEWTSASLLELCHLVVDCHNKTAPYVESGIPLVRTSNIKGGAIIFDEKMRYINEETYDYWARRCPPEPGDILFTREAPMGESAIVPKGERICMGQRMMLLRVFHEFTDVNYLHAAMMSLVIQQEISSLAVAVGVQHMRVGDVESLVVPVPTLEEQRFIAEEINQRLAAIHELEKSLDSELQRSERLRQSVLQGAFGGG